MLVRYAFVSVTPMASACYDITVTTAVFASLKAFAMSPGRTRMSEAPTSPGLDTLGELFSSRIRASVLTYLVAREDARFSLTELSRALGISVSSVQHECYKLERLGVLKGRREGASRRYWLDRDLPFVPVLMWLVISVAGQSTVLGYALQDIEGLESAVLGDGPTLTLIGNLGLEQLATVHERAAKLLDIPQSQLNVAFYDPATWAEYVSSNHAAVQAIRAASPIVLIGDPSLTKEVL